MKKFAILLVVIIAAAASASAQKFALVDMEYILKNVPAYEMANEQLNQLSQRWQKEVEAVGVEAQNMYQNFIADKVFLTDEQIKKREEEIVAKEKEANGIEGFLTQPVFSPRALKNLRQAREELGGAIYGGIMPIVSYRNACFLKNEITGMDIPDELAESFQNKTREECEEISKAFCFEKMEEMKDLVDGFYLMTPFRRIGLICDLIQQARRLESV